MPEARATRAHTAGQWTSASCTFLRISVSVPTYHRALRSLRRIRSSCPIRNARSSNDLQALSSSTIATANYSGAPSDFRVEHLVEASLVPGVSLKGAFLVLPRKGKAQGCWEWPQPNAIAQVASVLRVAVVLARRTLVARRTSTAQAIDILINLAGAVAVV
eukprot:CAMPEP_0171624134 /NCGR_PEP_ID=MMETSP0990-20121206/18417_1 /TAXON_ID=483369 /ORGANISM="non described non described, Strain CCMP2098" /LENGTH=160 /DNA_ID=CAMNT_0012190583 /DNA_START=294 /DNA_END=775 /DNA_ORIENTATION=-